MKVFPLEVNIPERRSLSLLSAVVIFDNVTFSLTEFRWIVLSEKKFRRKGQKNRIDQEVDIRKNKDVYYHKLVFQIRGTETLHLKDGTV